MYHFLCTVTLYEVNGKAAVAAFRDTGTLEIENNSIDINSYGNNINFVNMQLLSKIVSR
jgi:hypothetical protein